MATKYNPTTLIGRSLYWVLDEDPHSILEFDLDRQSLAVMGSLFFNQTSPMLGYFGGWYGWLPLTP
jgi:hypothetical protein